MRIRDPLTRSCLVFTKIVKTMEPTIHLRNPRGNATKADDRKSAGRDSLLMVIPRSGSSADLAIAQVDTARIVQTASFLRNKRRNERIYGKLRSSGRTGVRTEETMKKSIERRSRIRRGRGRGKGGSGGKGRRRTMVWTSREIYRCVDADDAD